MSHRQLYSEKKSDINVYDLATLLYCEKQENMTYEMNMIHYLTDEDIMFKI